MNEFKNKILNMIKQSSNSNTNHLIEVNSESSDQSRKYLKNPNSFYRFNHIPIREYINCQLMDQHSADCDLQFYLEKEKNPQMMDQIE